jgi:dephospho-CoA kinase
MKSIALTGGIACGKSTVASLLRDRGVPVVDSDDLARTVVAPGQPALDEIKAAFGVAVLHPDGSLHREALASLIFVDHGKRRLLEAITHPRIRQLWRAHLDSWHSSGCALGGVVIPLLYEAGLADEFDAVICVACSAETQFSRLQARGLSPEASRERIAAQHSVADKLARAHHVIWTEGSPDLIRPQWDKITSQI